MRFGVGCLVVLSLVITNTLLADDDDAGEDLTDEQAAILDEEKDLLAEYKEAAELPVKKKKKQQKAVARLRSQFLRLYEKSKGELTEESLILLGDLTRVISPSDAATMNKTAHEELMNQAGVFYEDAYQKHKSVVGYFKLAQCAQSLAMWEGNVGNESGKDQLLQQASSMFLVAASKGHSDAYKELSTMCEKNIGFGDGGCPQEMKKEVVQYYETMTKEDPINPYWPGKLAMFRASGFGYDSADLPTACKWAKQAAEANLLLLNGKEDEAGREIEPSEFESIGLDTNNFILDGNCKYFHNFQTPGDGLDRAAGRKILQHGLDYKLSFHADDEESRKRIKDSLLSMIGPEDEPSHSGKIEWSEKVADLGDTWYVYVWESYGRGFFWSPSLRMGDTPLKVTKKDANLIDFAAPTFILEADSFIAAVPGASPAYLSGRARHVSQHGAELHGTFSFSVVPQVAKLEL